uniref:Uncharacterized protein n=2 Tax=Sphaerodactylus townsendi TaxID=933632 RepID=A0ACB8FNL8_9SAUR
MSEIKQRRKTDISAKPNEDQQKVDKQSWLGCTRTSFWMEAGVAASCLSVMACVGLTWFLIQQSAQLATVEEKYHLLKQEAEKFQDMENKVKLMSTKLESSLQVLQEASTSVSVLTKLEQEVAGLRNIIPDILNSEQKVSKKVQSVNERFQNVVVSWKRSLNEMDTNTSSLRSEAKFLHNEVTTQINAVDSRIKTLSEKLADLEDSTIRNVKVLNRQEENDLSKIEQQLQVDAESTKEIEEKQNTLARNKYLRQKLAAHELKVEECKAHLPLIETAIHSVIQVSGYLMDIGKKVEDMGVKVFDAEDKMVTARLEIMNIQKDLENIQDKNSRLKLQKDACSKS